MWFFKIFIFTKKNEREMHVKKQRKYFEVFIYLGSTMIDLAPTYFYLQ